MEHDPVRHHAFFQGIGCRCGAMQVVICERDLAEREAAGKVMERLERWMALSLNHNYDVGRDTTDGLPTGDQVYDVILYRGDGSGAMCGQAATHTAALAAALDAAGAEQ